MGYIGFVLFLVGSSFLSGTVMELTYIAIGAAMPLEVFEDTYVLTSWAYSMGLATTIMLMITPKRCLPWWTSEDLQYFEAMGTGSRFALGFIFFLVLLFGWVFFPLGDWTGAGVVRFLLFGVTAFMGLTMVGVIMKPDMMFNQGEEEDEDWEDEDDDWDEDEDDDHGDDEDWEDDVRSGDNVHVVHGDQASAPNAFWESLREVEDGPDADFASPQPPVCDVEDRIRASFPDNSFKEELMLKAHENIQALHGICDDIETFNSVADDNLRTVVEIMENMFDIILENPDRLNDTARNTLTVFLEKILRIGKNLHLLLRMNSRDDEKYQRIQEVFMEFERILNHRRDTLFAAEMSELDTDLSMLEDEVASIAAREKLKAVMDA